MSAVSERRRRLIRVWAWTIIFAATLAAPAARADSVTVNVDQARVMRLPWPASSSLIGATSIISWLSRGEAFALP